MPAKKKGLKIEPMTAEQEEWADEVKAQLDVLKNEKIQMKVERASAKGKDSLNLHDKRLNGVPEDIANIPNCKSIILSKNNLEELPESLYHIASLEKLDLSGNHFQKLPDEISHLPKLRELYLQNNKLIAIPSTVSEVPLPTHHILVFAHVTIAYRSTC